MAEGTQQPRQAMLAALTGLLRIIQATLFCSPGLPGAWWLVVSPLALQRLLPGRPCLRSSTILSASLLCCNACCAAGPCSVCMQAHMLRSAVGRLSCYRVASACLLRLFCCSDTLDCWHLKCGLHKENAGRAR